MTSTEEEGPLVGAVFILVPEIFRTVAQVAFLLFLFEMKVSPSMQQAPRCIRGNSASHGQRLN